MTPKAASGSTASQGPDEYSAIADNNVYTNLRAQRNLLAAADAVAAHARHAATHGADFEEAARWRDAGEDMVVPWDDDLDVHPQSEGFTSHQAWDFERTPADRYPLLLHYPSFDLYRKQVVKQADLVLALHARGLLPGRPVEVDLPRPADSRPAPSQPRGRAPLRRGAPAETDTAVS